MQREASCGCGAVRVSVEGDPQLCWVCHCDHCQKLSGSIGLFAAVFREEDVVGIVGETTTHKGNQDKWPGAERYFCSNCGTSVHWINPSAFPEMRLIATGCFSDPKFPGPSLAMQTKYRHKWCGNFEGAATFEGYPE